MMRKILFILFSVSMALQVSMATPILNNVNYWGDATGATSGWSPMDESTVATRKIDLSTSAGGVTTIGFTGDAIGGPVVVVGDTDVNFSGNFASYNANGGLSVGFTLKSLTVAPASLNLYFISSADGGSRWVSTTHIILSGISINTPMTYSISIADPSAWEIWSGPGSSFANAYQAVSEFGFELVGASYGGSQTNQFYDVYFSVPEPETVWMILAVLASLGITFRMRLLELGKQALARIKA